MRTNPLDNLQVKATLSNSRSQVRPPANLKKSLGEWNCKLLNKTNLQILFSTL